MLWNSARDTLIMKSSYEQLSREQNTCAQTGIAFNSSYDVFFISPVAANSVKVSDQIFLFIKAVLINLIKLCNKIFLWFYEIGNIFKVFDHLNTIA